MEITVLGSDGTWPGAGGVASGYLIHHDGFRIWMDMGTGTMASLQEHVGFREIDAVVVSHVHADHFVDLFPYFYARRYGEAAPAPQIPVFAPTGTRERVRAMLSDSGWEEFPMVFDLREIEPGSGFEVGPFRVRTERMAHPIPTLGLRYETDGRAFAYSADTGPSPALVDLAKDADLLFAEATWLDDGIERPPDLHMCAREAGEHAARAAVGRLVLTHIHPEVDRAAARAEGSGPFDGPVADAVRSARWVVGE